MRLIDADALIQDLDIWYKEVGHETPRDRLIQNIITYAMDAVNDAESVDAEPVRHGFWNWGLGFPYCSKCKKIAHKKGFAGYHTSDYCPNCGAKMY